MKTKLSYFILLFFVGFFGYSQTILRLDSNYPSTAPASYTFSSTDVIYRDAIGTIFGNRNTSNICSGATYRTQLPSVILELKSSSVSNIIVHGQSSGSSLRTLTSIETSSTLSGTYNSLSGFSTSSTINSNTACGTLSISNLSLPANTFIKLTFSGNINFSGFDLTPSSVSEPTTQATNVAFSNVLSNSFTTSWTNGDGSNRAVFVKEGTQGSITNPVDGEVYTASSNWNNGSPSGTQLGTSGYYCVYNGNGNSVNLTNLNPNTTYWVQVFDYNGTTTSTNYVVATATGNPASQATSVATAPTFYRSLSSGDWSDSAIWETSTDNSTWGAASVYPDFNNSNAITIKNGHTVSISGATIIADQLVVEASAVLLVASGATFTIADGTADDLIVHGNLELLGTFSSLTGATTIVNGVFENKVNAASFSAGSGSISVSAGGTYKINGYTGTSAYAFTNVAFVAGIGAAGSNYYVASGAPRITSAMNLANVIWDSPTVGGSFLNNPSASISGNFIMLSSPGINHGAGGSGRALTIAGDLVIQGGKYEISGSGATAANNLTVNGNVTLNAGSFNLSSSTVVGGFGNLNAKGNIALNDGTFGLASGSSNGNLILNGTAAQNVSLGATTVATVQNLTVSNNAGVSFSGTNTFNVQGDVSFGNVNNATISAAGKLKLISNENFTGRVADITNNGVNSGNTISGDVIVERYIPLGKRAFRFLTPGVSTTNFILNNWQLGTHITGSTTVANGFDITSTGNPSMYTYNNQATSGTGWTAIANTDVTD
jgi:hypothetical protein